MQQCELDPPLSAAVQCPMANDDEELESELAWSDPEPERDLRFFKTRPAGTSVMISMAAFMFVTGLGFYLRMVGTVSTEHGIAPVSMGLTFCVFMIFAARAASRAIWIRLGASVRGSLRPMGRVGVVPMLLVVLFLSGTETALFRAGESWAVPGKSFAEALRGGPLEGADFVIAADAAGRLMRMPAAEARTFCASKGAGWRLPRRGDEEFLTSRVTVTSIRQGESIAAEPSALEGPFVWSPVPGGFQRTLPTDPGGDGVPTPRWAVICVRP